MPNEPQHSRESENQQKSKNRRSSPRHRVEASIQWHLAEEKPVVVREGKLVDLSAVGAAFRTSAALQTNTLVSLKLPPKKIEQAVPKARGTESGAESNSAPQGASKSLTVKGVIVNSHQLEDGSWRYGLKLDRIYFTLTQWLSESSLASYPYLSI